MRYCPSRSPTGMVAYRSEHTVMSTGHPRRLLQALLSALLPGAGQLAAGRNRRALVLLCVVVVLALAGVAVLVWGVDEFLAWMIQPAVLLGLLGLDIVLLGFRLFAATDAYLQPRTGRPTTLEDVSQTRRQRAARRPRTGPRAWLAGFALAVLLLLVAAPHVVAGYYLYLSRDLVTTVFSDVETVSTTTPPVSVTTTVSVAPPSTTTQSPVSSVTTTTFRLTTTTTIPTTTILGPPVAWEERLTLLLIGTDAGAGRRGARADSIMVATLDLENGYVGIFGIPRNTGDLPLSGDAARVLGTDLYPGMISNLYSEASRHPELAPEGGDPGAVVLRDVAARLLDLQVDHYAVVDMGGFVDLVDAFGGIKLNVKERVWVRLSPPTPDEDYRVYDILPGIQELDGHQALAFARSRTGSDDYDRMRRQRCVIMALLSQNGVADLVLKFADVVEVVRDNLKTDLPLEQLRELIKVRGVLKTDRMYTVGLGPPDYTAGRNELGYNILDRKLVPAVVRDFIEDPEAVLQAEASAPQGEPADCWKVD